MKKFKATPYSCYDQYKTVAHGDNISSVVDRMIRVTAKVTEIFAGDITFDIASLNKAVEENIELKLLLTFRDGGVNSRTVASFDEFELGDGGTQSGIQFWGLTHEKSDDSNEFKTTFERLSVIAI